MLLSTIRSWLSPQTSRCRRSAQAAQADRRSKRRAPRLWAEMLEDRTTPDCTGLTVTQGGWGAVANGNNPATYRDANFDSAFPDGLQIGDQTSGAATTNNTAGNWAALFDTAMDIQTYLPDGGTAAPLGGDYVDPTHLNVLAGQTVALTLTVGFDAADPNFDGDPTNTALGSMVYQNPSSPLDGMTVNEILAAANVYLSGATSPYTAPQLASAIDDINRNFDNGVDLGFLECVNHPPFGPEGLALDCVDVGESLTVTAADMLDGFVDPDGDPLAVTAVDATTALGVPISLDDNGTPADPADDFVVYTPNAGLFGVDSFGYTVSDGNGGTATGTVTLDLNHAPVADDANLGTAVNPGVPVTTGVLYSDADFAPADTLVVTITAAPTQGSVVDNGDGTFTYTADPGAAGDDGFMYSVYDGCDTVIGKVMLYVNSPPFGPEGLALDCVDVGESLTVTAADMLDGFVDPDGDPLAVTAVDATTALGVPISLDDNGTPADPADDFVVYTPNAGLFGVDSFGYTVSDGNGGTATGTVTLDLNHAPVAVNDTVPGSLLPGGSVVISKASLLANDTDADGDTLVFALVTGPAQGTLVDNGDGTLTYTAPASPVGSSTSFTYSVFDGCDTVPAAVTINFAQLGAGGGHTLGFWSNKNGEAKINDGGTSAPELALLSSLNLRNANGTNFDPANYASFRTWILSATGTNMAYMLSAQLAAMALNVEAGFVNGNALVYAADLYALYPTGNAVIGLNADGTITVNDLINAANTELLAHGTAVSGDAWRVYQTALKNALDLANNNLNFVI